MTPSVRAARPADAEAIALLAGGALPEAWTTASFRAALARRESRAFVAHVGGELVGFALALRSADQAELLSLAVVPSQRRRGLGRKLLDALLAALRADGAAQLYLEVRCSNQPALALYTSSGFEVAGRRARYYRDGEDALTLGCAL
jgi:ribosomal-protein-alanine N-acetyltransferase